MLLKLIIFVIVSIGLAYVSRSSLRVPRSHGFYRFLAWEAMTVLILLNVDYWFERPLSLQQIISWLLLIISLILVAHGVQLLRMVGKPNNQREDQSLLGFEKTTTLVRVGAYKYIRHPLYASLLFLAWGTFFKDLSWLSGILTAAATLFLVLTAKMEEQENTRFFGPDYQTYISQTKMFIPFLF